MAAILRGKYFSRWLQLPWKWHRLFLLCTLFTTMIAGWSPLLRLLTISLAEPTPQSLQLQTCWQLSETLHSQEDCSPISQQRRYSCCLLAKEWSPSVQTCRVVVLQYKTKCWGWEGRGRGFLFQGNPQKKILQVLNQRLNSRSTPLSHPTKNLLKHTYYRSVFHLVQEMAFCLIFRSSFYPHQHLEELP